MSKVEWTDDRIERLKAFYAEGTPLRIAAGFFGTGPKTVRAAAKRFGIAAPRPSTGWIKTHGPEAIRMYQEGMTFAVIAKAIGPGVTRGAVSGYLDRSGALRPDTPRKPTVRRVFTPRPALTVAPNRAADAQGGAVHILNRVEAPQKPMGKDHGLTATATLTTLGAYGCKWPIGDPRDADFGFCGRAREHHAYCEAHRAVAYQAVPEAKAKARGLKRLLRVA